MKVEISKEAKLPSKFGEFIVQSFKESKDDGQVLEHLVVRTQNLESNPLIRVHSECLTGDALGSLKCDCGPELAQALERIHESKNGMLIYLRQEGRGIGLFQKINAYSLQDSGYDTVEANLALGFKEDERSYEIVGFILEHYKITKANLMTNNPKKVQFLEKFIEVERKTIYTMTNPHNEGYLKVKQKKLGHLLDG